MGLRPYFGIYDLALLMHFLEIMSMKNRESPLSKSGDGN